MHFMAFQVIHTLLVWTFGLFDLLGCFCIWWMLGRLCCIDESMILMISLICSITCFDTFRYVRISPRKRCGHRRSPSPLDGISLRLSSFDYLHLLWASTLNGTKFPLDSFQCIIMVSHLLLKLLHHGWVDQRYRLSPPNIGKRLHLRTTIPLWQQRYEVYPAILG